MNEAGDNGKAGGEKKNSWVKNRLIPLLGLLIVVAIAVGIFCFYKYQPEKIEQLEELGYLGVFLSSLVLNATVVLPAGNFVFLFVLGGALPSPILVGLIGADARKAAEEARLAGENAAEDVMKRLRKLFLKMAKDITEALGEGKK